MIVVSTSLPGFEVGDVFFLVLISPDREWDLKLLVSYLFLLSYRLGSVHPIAQVDYWTECLLLAVVQAFKIRNWTL